MVPSPPTSVSSKLIDACRSAPKQSRVASKYAMVFVSALRFAALMEHNRLFLAKSPMLFASLAPTKLWTASKMSESILLRFPPMPRCATPEVTASSRRAPPRRRAHSSMNLANDPTRSRRRASASPTPGQPVTSSDKTTFDAIRRHLMQYYSTLQGEVS